MTEMKVKMVARVHDVGKKCPKIIKPSTWYKMMETKRAGMQEAEEEKKAKKRQNMQTPFILLPHNKRRSQHSERVMTDDLFSWCFSCCWKKNVAALTHSHMHEMSQLEKCLVMIKRKNVFTLDCNHARFSFRDFMVGVSWTVYYLK